MMAGVLGMTCGAMLVFFLAVDLLWLGVVARRFYLKHLGRFFAERVNWATAFLFLPDLEKPGGSNQIEIQYILEDVVCQRSWPHYP
jgi:hypothetical protein